MAIPQSTADHYRTQQRLAAATVAASRRAWAQMGNDFDRSWSTVGPRLAVLTVAAQLAAARAGAASVPLVLAETGQPDEPVGEVVPRRFAGVAADGRPLDTLLYGAVLEAKIAMRSDIRTEGNTTTMTPGRGSSEALAQGGRWLDMAVQTLVADAARGSSGVAIAARPAISGYVRMLNAPSCSRCAILAGKFFRWNAGFLRHPRCDCRHIPASEDIAGDFRTNPEAAARAGQITDLRPADVKALGEGADLSQLVNARRGSSGMTATQGATRRGLAGQRLGAARGSRATRLTPEGIYARAGADRTEAIRLLREHAYLI